MSKEQSFFRNEELSCRRPGARFTDSTQHLHRPAQFRDIWGSLQIEVVKQAWDTLYSVVSTSSSLKGKATPEREILKEIHSVILNGTEEEEK